MYSMLYALATKYRQKKERETLVSLLLYPEPGRSAKH